jgi:CelD/BcsL family acetyltransferase involved in cellulose biosynthesis
VEYDWLGGEEAYKSAWSDATRAETELLFSRTLPGHLWAFWRGFRADFWEAATRQARKHVPQSLRDRVNQWLAPKYNKDAAGGEEHAGEKEQNQE